MTNQSVADIDDFIRQQKQKLSNDRSAFTPNQFQNQNQYYENGQISPRSQNNNQQYGIQEVPSPRLALKQMHPSPSIYVPLEEQPKVQNHRITKKYDDIHYNDNFFDKFGGYDKKKQQLNNDLKNDYAQYMQNKNGRNSDKRRQEPSEFYATLPLKDHNSAKKRAMQERNQDYNFVQEKIKHSEKGNLIEWWKDHSPPDIKPYSKHASNENLDIFGNPSFRPLDKNKSQSQSDVIANRRLQLEPSKPTGARPPPFAVDDQSAFRPRSANLNEPSRQKSAFDPSLRQGSAGYDLPPRPNYSPINDPYRVSSGQYISDDRVRPNLDRLERLDTKIRYDLGDNGYNQPNFGNVNVTGNVDPSLTDILRRPPVGTRFSPVPQLQNNQRVQFNDNIRYEEPPPQQYNNVEQQFRRNPNNNQNLGSRPNRSNQNNVDPAIANRINQTQSRVFDFNGQEPVNDKASKAREYQEELQRQVREKQLAKQREKEEQDRQDKLLDKINEMYNPFGRGGGGAPIKDKDGNVAADLSKVLAGAVDVDNTAAPPQKTVQFDLSSNRFSGPPSPDVGLQFGNNTNRKAKEEGNFARGGNGIFGEAKSDNQKKNEEKYKQELQRQIEEKKRREAEEKAKIRFEEEKEMKRFEEQQKRIKAEMEEEEKRKREKEVVEKQKVDANYELVQNRKKAQKGRKFQPKENNDEPTDQPIQSPPPPPPLVEFRSKSPPLPALQKKKSNAGQNKNNNSINKPPPRVPSNISLNRKESNDNIGDLNNGFPTTADYFTTESRLNNGSPTKKSPSANNQLVSDYENNNFKNKTRSPPGKVQRTPSPPKEINQKTSRIEKSKAKENNIRPPSINSIRSHQSSSDVLQQLQNLKKHLQKEQIQVENELNNANSKVSVGQLVDSHQKMLSVRTPPDSANRNKNVFYTAAMHNEPARVKRETPDLNTYRKYLRNIPPYTGGNEPRTYFRENSVLLNNARTLRLNDDYDDLTTELERNANTRIINKNTNIHYKFTDPYSLYAQTNIDDNYDYDVNNLTTRNEQRLKKLRDLEGDNLSLADPNDVLNKFLNRNNSSSYEYLSEYLSQNLRALNEEVEYLRRPSVTTLQDDTWTRNPI